MLAITTLSKVRDCQQLQVPYVEECVQNGCKTLPTRILAWSHQLRPRWH